VTNRVFLLTIALLFAGGACRTANKQGPDSRPGAANAGPVDNRPVLGALTKPPPRPRDCGPFGKPWVPIGAPRIRDVSEGDAQVVTALMRQYVTMPLIGIAQRNGLIEASAGCCSSVPDDCSRFMVRFDKQPTVNGMSSTPTRRFRRSG
jgi:hypothetical protein